MTEGLRTWLPSWTVARAAPRTGAVALALKHAARLGFDAYSPMCVSVRWRRGRRQESVRRLFPGYIFVFVENAWHALLNAPGFASFIMLGEQPAVLPRREVQKLRAKEDWRGLIPLQPFTPGQRVFVQSGVLATDATYVGQSPRGREVVLLRVLGREVRAELGEDVALAAV